MPDSDSPQTFAILYSPNARATRNELPEKPRLAVADVVDRLAVDPEAFPGRTQRDGRIRLYTHPDPALQITFEIDPEKRLLSVLHVAAPQVPVKRSVFISYSHEDHKWLVRLKRFLDPLEQQGLIHVWDDQEIRPGMDWLEQIRRSLESTRVAVLLVTQNFLTSRFIGEKELPALLESAKDQGCLIFWIAVSASTFEDSSLGKFQAANDPKRPLDSLRRPKQEQVLREIYDKMKAAVTRN